ncbi:MAG: hypothetical protein [Bacteriophage sp.]|nr:MAG: hypothetical protein [Bacteriophage sp.]
MSNRFNRFPFLDYYNMRAQVETKPNLEVGQKIGIHDSDTVTYKDLYDWIVDASKNHDKYTEDLLLKLESSLNDQINLSAEDLAAVSSQLFNFIFQCLVDKKLATVEQIQNLTTKIEEQTTNDGQEKETSTKTQD